MIRYLKPLINWFGYSRRERRASVILLIIMVLVIIIRYTVPERRINIEDMSALLVPIGGQELATVKREPEPFVSGEIKSRPVFLIKEKSAFQKEKTEINSCDSSDLERLPGIGPVLSARIIKYRKLLGGYVSVTQLREVYGLTDSTYLLISDRITADSSLVKKININSAGFSELNRHPYLERYDVQAIMKYREIKGRIGGSAELSLNKILTGDKAAKIFPYLRFD